MVKKKMVNVVSKYLKKFGLSKAKQIVYIMRTSEDEYPKNKYPNWEDYIKAKTFFRISDLGEISSIFYICSNTIEEMQYQLNHYKGAKHDTKG